MCERWKGFYKEHDVPYRVGVELLSVERRDDGVLHVMCWDHNSRNEKNYLAKHMVISIGHGVPRRFDIPGNTDGIHRRLTDPDQYVGRPACVLGGGTSSSEAVIAISNAKIAAKDKSAVYWSYRGDRMPRVSKNLADVFFEAYVGNGNIRYYPNSEPTAVITAGDHQEYLSILIDRAKITGRPNETQYLEFPKKDVLACVGEDVPEALLNSLGIEMVKGGKRGKKRMVINRLMETKQPNIYMIGDLLSQAYFETENFDADPSEFVEVKHRGNIKNTLRDGVRCANIIKQRLDGKTDIVTTIEDYEPSNVA
jgi:thioredoxin reductase